MMYHTIRSLHLRLRFTPFTHHSATHKKGAQRIRPVTKSRLLKPP